MCIMEVRPGQKSSTIAQAMAHNVSTIERDMDMFEELLKAREDFESLDTVQEAHLMLKRAYANLLMQFGIEVAKEIEGNHIAHLHSHESGEVHSHDNSAEKHDHGTERTFIEQAHHDAQLARKYETR